ncbi:hypothetical protein QFC19_002870 [Naganishia cerealis]|uniref:Uncharacterized protein n=1 Tax=Naganishia cerealis TaxID=610337 RepID=A0ACC2W5T1_9TREE|nr:hypothetical protein QFC19_002870 [Naganishia cerealis]
MHPRTRTLAAATLVALCSGTNYVFSAYAPQLAARCGLSSTQLNLVGIAGNLGVYTSGPVWGVFIDRNGPRGVLACAAACIAVGYAGIRWLYVHSPVRVGEAARADTRTVALLCVCMLLTGYAASAGLNASLNTVARSFPSSSRATASGITLAGFGLSAFFFSSLAHAVFPGRTDAFLSLLAIGTAAGMLVGVVAVRTVPVVDEEEEEGYVPVHQDDEAGYVDIDTPAAVNAEPVLAEDDDYLTHPLHRSHNHTYYEDSVPLTVSRSRSTDLVRPSIDDTLPRSRSSLDRQDGANEPPCVPLLLPPAEKSLLGKAVTGQVSGRQLISSADFWTIVAILTLLSGTGLMYINNVGSVVLALANHPPSLLDTFPDPREVAKVQARQVSVISIWNCLGRIIMGLVSDFAKTRYGVNRVWFTLAIALLFLASQLSVQMTTDMYALSLVSALLGSAYGMLFALLPILVLEWFGLGSSPEAGGKKGQKKLISMPVGWM